MHTSSTVARVLSTVVLQLLVGVETTTFLAFEDYLDSPEALKLARGKLLDQLSASVGNRFSAAAEVRAPGVEDALRTTYAALPKNEYGRIDGAAVRFSLHRYFVNRHGWYVNGVDHRGEAWNSSIPFQILQGTSAEGATKLFAEQLADRGFSLHEVAVLAATIEHLVHEETAELLAKIYTAEGLTKSSTVNVQKAELLVEDYTMMRIYGGMYVHRNISRELLVVARNKIGLFYRNWPALQLFLKEARLEKETSRIQYFGFDDVLRILEHTADKQGKWQNVECTRMKLDLVEIEEGDGGRVAMSSFYNAAIHGKRQFRENVDYLSMLGSLDGVSGDADPRLIIPNYVTSPANCMAGSNYYKLCCMDECEPLMTHIEKAIRSHEASSAHIAQIVGNLPSSTMTTPREISPSLLKRLDSIAERHGGKVPLHGRLFAQWMHNAYPRECRYPHISGTTTPVSLGEWKMQTGKNITLTEAQMLAFIERAKGNTTNTKQDRTLVWSSTEEIMMMKKARPLLSKNYVWVFRLFALLAFVALSLSAHTKCMGEIGILRYGVGSPKAGKSRSLLSYPKQHLV